MYTMFLLLMIFKEKHGYTFSKFKEFKALIENHNEKNIKTFQSDNGREFKELCKDSRIKRELTTPYNPQQNGVTERKNRTIMEAARAMLYDQDIPMHLWAEATRIAMYVQNRTPHRVLENKTPEEVFSSKKPKANHLNNIRVSRIHTHSEIKEDKVRSFRKEGYICGIL